ncbi:MAG: S8 family serine peptidase, partial [Armatimonadota bacterium]|nr:S8 family serine peptidase [Armatimonadota bacterium]
ASVPTALRLASSTTYNIPLGMPAGTYPVPFDFPTSGQTPLSVGSYYWIVIDRLSGASALVGKMGPAVNYPGGVRKSRPDTSSAWGNPPAPNTNQDRLCYAVYGLPPGDWDDPNGHGTHTAGSVLGSGAASPVPGQFRGSAYGAYLVHQSLQDAFGSLGGIPSDIGDLFEQTRALDAYVHSDSWGSDVSGDYTTDSENLDAYVWNHPEFLPVFAAGNAGRDNSPANGVIDAGSMGSPASAKNCLTVGASESVRSGVGYNIPWGTGSWAPRYPNEPIKSDHVSNNYNGMAAFSSRGPCADGRVKPDVVAPGTNIVSALSKAPGAGTGWGPHSDPDYCYNGGTSMACPLAAGAAVLVREYFVERRSHVPSAALMKATLIHGATDMAPGQYGTGSTQELQPVPDFSQGWGRVNLYRSLFPVVHGLNGNYLDATAANGLALNNTAGGQSRVARVQVGGTSAPLKATLVWTDPPANAAGAGGLINDLDLRIYRLDPTGTFREATYLPKQPGGPAADDAVNNVEQVEVDGTNLVVG